MAKGDAMAAMAARVSKLDPVDTGVFIPKAVRDAAARADAMVAEMSGTPAPAPEPPPEPAPPPVDPPVAPPLEMHDAPPLVPEPAHDDNDQSWKHRYDSMKGRYDAENRRFGEEIRNLHSVIASMQVSAPATAPAAARQERLITPQEETDYGQDFLTVVGKKAKEEIFPEIQAMRDKLASLEGRVDNVGSAVTQDARGRMHEYLGSNVPDWLALNEDQSFISWLALPDAYSGAIRQDLLKAAYERNDALRVAAFFKGFLAEEAATTPRTAGRTPAPAPTKVPLETFAAPGRAKSAAGTPPAAPAEKPIITRADIVKFYADVNAGKYRGHEAEKAQAEKEIFAAQSDGRIR